jgi:dihydroneopterin aldolase
MRIRIADLTFETIIGILDYERQTPQRVVVDCTLDYEGEYVDYGVIREIIVQTVQKEAFGLIEEALPVVIKKIHDVFPQIDAVHLRIAKPDIFDDCSVSVEEQITF